MAPAPATMSGSSLGTSPIPGVSMTIYYVIVIVAPVGFVIVVVVVAILIWKFAGKGGPDKQFSDNEDSVSM